MLHGAQTDKLLAAVMMEFAGIHLVVLLCIVTTCGFLFAISILVSINNDSTHSLCFSCLPRLSSAMLLCNLCYLFIQNFRGLISCMFDSSILYQEEHNSLSITMYLFITMPSLSQCICDIINF